jgi:hypothetical protein
VLGQLNEFFGNEHRRWAIPVPQIQKVISVCLFKLILGRTPPG